MGLLVSVAIFLTLCTTTPISAVIGISSRRAVEHLLLSQSLVSVDLNSADLHKLCSRIGLPSRGFRRCCRSREEAGALLEAAWVGLTHCQKLLHYNRWNCSLGHSRRKLIKKAFPETSLLNALSAASVSHVVSRACASGRLTRCTCDETTGSPTKTWRWGGCGDNLKYGTRFAKRLFLGTSNKKRKKSKERIKSLDIKSQVDAHNAMAGMLVVMEGTLKSCKCHGVSGSCAMKTCWNQLPSFTQTGHLLTQMYHTAQIADTANVADIGNRTKKKSTKRNKRPKGNNVSAIKEIGNDLKVSIKIERKSKRSLDFEINIDESYHISSPQRQPRDLHSPSRDKEAVNEKVIITNKPRVKKKLKDNRRFPGPLGSAATLGSPRQLLYLDRSPNFCRDNRYGPGTANRQCSPAKACLNLCCGRGYNTHQIQLNQPCQCKVIWCCKVQCKNCTSISDIYTCK